ncbi:MAG: hypothetical protein GOMPHAMPRED_003368 [Gomphillus americanus]|uniref:AB hydrolase-1 domain-containing protein n=1 Tax=Gomphillus americanus TaxID=1940652 RepID=A0A8H3EMW2_9LECA|nr:MAG: hypothetical protein GOMPHAMPRED_003368 [Gomphillus americanus]
MDHFQQKTLTTKPYGLTYSYYLSPNFQAARQSKLPVLLFVHGYPDDAWMWQNTIKHTNAKQWPMMCLDLLGFGGSSKPTEVAMYNYKQQADSIAQIMDVEDIKDNIIPIGHDWGSGVSQRFYLYHRERCVGLVLLCLAYQVPSPEPFSLQTANQQTSERFGYPQWEYWNFFTASDAPAIMKADLKRFFEVNNGYLESPVPGENKRDIWMREMFCVPGAMRDYMLGQGKYKDFTVALKPYQDLQGHLKRFVERLSKDGLEGPVNYYHSLKNNTMLDDERLLCNSPNDQLRKIEVPLLYIGTTGDWVCRTDLMSDAKKLGLAPDCEEKVIDAGHWVMYEKPDEVASRIQDWLLKRFD